MATSSPQTATATGLSTSQSNQQQHQLQIFCFGDSLTAGTSPPDYFTTFPYAPHLETALNQRGVDVQVSHVGLPGWTSKHMLEAVNAPKRGLRTMVREMMQSKKKSPPLSLVAILAGTNDLGYMARQKKGRPDVARNIQALHDICHEEGVPNTIAIAIPPSQYQANDAAAATLAGEINEQLSKYCDESSSQTYFPFPFSWEEGHVNWCPDGLHLTFTGYKSLGESLAPTIEKMLLENGPRVPTDEGNSLIQKTTRAFNDS